MKDWEPKNKVYVQWRTLTLQLFTISSRDEEVRSVEVFLSLEMNAPICEVGRLLSLRKLTQDRIHLSSTVEEPCNQIGLPLLSKERPDAVH